MGLDLHTCDILYLHEVIYCPRRRGFLTSFSHSRAVTTNLKFNPRQPLPILAQQRTEGTDFRAEGTE